MSVTTIQQKNFDVNSALKKALNGGLSGASAMAIQVATLMPLRTTMNYQYRYGTSTTEALKTLYSQGGVKRFYSGVLPALVQGPLSRFGDTAANAGILAFLDSNESMKNLPVAVKTVGASIAAASFRMVLTPVDTLKTTLQTQGKAGLPLLRARIAQYGVVSLWYGSVAAAVATAVGHFPWFFVYNQLSVLIPQQDTTLTKLGRQAFIGFTASVASDTISNSVRVIKTYRQVNETKVSYYQAAKNVVDKDGLSGLFGRGLKTRIVTNGIQGLMFSVLWKIFQDMYNKE